MNIFVVDRDPIQAAKDLSDKHVVKMIVEGCQMLSTIHHIGGNTDSILYKKSFENHPCTIWARQSSHNYLWLARHTNELSKEYTHRYGKIHKAHELTEYFLYNVPQYVVKNGRDLTPFAQAMPEQYKNIDAVTAYRNYYIHEKASFATWKDSARKPDWFSEGVKHGMSMQVL